jgi:hypothetical protein
MVDFPFLPWGRFMVFVESNQKMGMAEAERRA